MDPKDYSGGPPPMPEAPAMAPGGSGKPAMGGDEDCVPLDALKMPGQDEQMMAPEVGDPVTYTIEGKLSRIEGNQAYVKRDTVNGKPLNSEAAKVNDTDGEQANEFSQLKEMASNKDRGMM